jgi:hypothetical protein
VRRTVDPHELCELLLWIARSSNIKASDRTAAIVALWDRGWGRPASTVDITARIEPEPSADDRKLRALSDTDLEVLARLDEDEPDAIDVPSTPALLSAGNAPGA